MDYNDENENILYYKKLKRNLKRSHENINEFSNYGSLNDTLYMFSSNKKIHSIDQIAISNNCEHVEICSSLNRKNKRKLETDLNDKYAKKIFTEVSKNQFSIDNNLKNNLSSIPNNMVLTEINDKYNKNSLMNNDELISTNNIKENEKKSMELAIIPFEDNVNASSYNKYENNVIIKNYGLKEILNLLSKKDIVYKNLKNHLKNNKPLMINCKNFNLLNKYINENEFYNKCNDNQTTLDIYDNYELYNGFSDDAVVLPDNNIEPVNLNDVNKIENNIFSLNNNDLLDSRLNKSYSNVSSNICDTYGMLHINHMNNMNGQNNINILSTTSITDPLNSNIEEINHMGNNSNFNKIYASNNPYNVNNYHILNNENF